MLTAIILCGGEGKRIKHITKGIPKCVYPIHNKPFLKYLIDQLKESELVDRIILLTADKCDTIINSLWPRGNFMMGKFDNYTLIKDDDMEFIFPKDRVGLGTALALYEAKNFILKYPVLISNGDTLVDFELSDMLSYHYFKRSNITISSNQRNDSGVWLMDEMAFNSLHIAKTRLFQYREKWLFFVKGMKIEHFPVEKFIDMGTPDGLIAMEDYLSNSLNGDKNEILSYRT